MRDGVGLTLTAARKFSENIQFRIKSAGGLSFEIMSAPYRRSARRVGAQIFRKYGPFSDQARRMAFRLAL
jgi:hypothetical protein